MSRDTAPQRIWLHTSHNHISHEYDDAYPSAYVPERADLSPAVTVKPDREAVARAIWLNDEDEYTFDDAVKGSDDKQLDALHKQSLDYVYSLADAAISALTPTTGEREAALREAAKVVSDAAAWDMGLREQADNTTNTYGADFRFKMQARAKRLGEVEATILALIDTPAPPAAPEPTVQEAARVLLALDRQEEPMEITQRVLEIMDDGETGPARAWLRAIAEQD